MKKIVLFKLKRPDIKISMEIYFNQEGQLIFDMILSKLEVKFDKRKENDKSTYSLIVLKVN